MAGVVEGWCGNSKMRGFRLQCDRSKWAGALKMGRVTVYEWGLNSDLWEGGCLGTPTHRRSKFTVYGRPRRRRSSACMVRGKEDECSHQNPGTQTHTAPDTDGFTSLKAERRNGDAVEDPMVRALSLETEGGVRGASVHEQGRG